MAKVLGVGNALVDLLIRLEDNDILDKLNLPLGSMTLVDEQTKKQPDEKQPILPESALGSKLILQLTSTHFDVKPVVTCSLKHERQYYCDGLATKLLQYEHVGYMIAANIPTLLNMFPRYRPAGKVDTTQTR